MASGYMFSHYWPGDGASPPVEEGTPGYSAWQSAVIRMLIFGLVLLHA